MNQFAAIVLTLLLAACSNEPAGVRLTYDQPAATAAIAPVARNEPVFYNGKIYRVALLPEQGGYGLNVSGMTAGQQKDAVALATSTLHHFTCKDSQKARFTAQPSYASGLWQFHGNCG